MFMEWIKIENYRNLVDMYEAFKKVILQMYINRYALNVKCPFLSLLHHFRI